MSVLKKLRFLPFFVAWIYCVILIILSFKTREISLSGNTIIPYTDNNANGTSRIVSCSLRAEKELEFKAVLDTGATYPIAGVRIQPTESEWNLSGFDFITFSFGKNSSDFNLTLTTPVKDLSTKDNVNSDRYHQMDFSVGDSLTVTCAMKDLQTPPWWYTMNDVKRESFGDVDYKKVSALIFSNHPSTKVGDTITFSIQSIRLSRNKVKPMLLLLLFLLLSGLIILFQRYQKGRIKTVLITEGASEGSSKKERLLLTLGKLASDSRITIERIAEESQVSVYHIRNILKEEFDATFLEYVKVVRVEKMKQLLSETDKEIKEIAYEVGFSHPSTATRAFKEMVGLSPSVFRAQK